ncbi:hypothetical protein BAE44_0002990, partial [Dichanthelium oligosanthes]
LARNPGGFPETTWRMRTAAVRSVRASARRRSHACRLALASASPPCCCRRQRREDVAGRVVERSEALDLVVGGVDGPAAWGSDSAPRVSRPEHVDDDVAVQPPASGFETVDLRGAAQSAACGALPQRILFPRAGGSRAPSAPAASTAPSSPPSLLRAVGDYGGGVERRAEARRGGAEARWRAEGWRRVRGRRSEEGVVGAGVGRSEGRGIARGASGGSKARRSEGRRQSSGGRGARQSKGRQRRHGGRGDEAAAGG